MHPYTQLWEHMVNLCVIRSYKFTRQMTNSAISITVASSWYGWTVYSVPSFAITLSVLSHSRYLIEQKAAVLIVDGQNARLCIAPRSYSTQAEVNTLNNYSCQHLQKWSTKQSVQYTIQQYYHVCTRPFSSAQLLMYIRGGLQYCPCYGPVCHALAKLCKHDVQHKWLYLQNENKGFKLQDRMLDWQDWCARR